MKYIDETAICKTPLVSTFIFTYNQEKYIEQSIKSLISQNCSFDYEIIICDDCSKDSTLSICLEYQKKYPQKIIVIENETNLGLRKNFFFNILNNVRGLYIACCAGDDWWSDSNKLEKQVAILKENPDYGMVHTRASVYIDKESRMSSNTIGSKGNTFFDNILTNHVAALTMCYTTKTFKDYVKEIDPVNLPFSEDYPMVLWYSYRSKVFFLDEVTSVYRFVINSVSHSTDLHKVYKGPQDFYDCGKLFIEKFGYKNDKLVLLSELRYHLDRIRWASLLGDECALSKAEIFFRDNGYCSFWFLSKLYHYCGSKQIFNNVIFKLSLLIRRIHPTYKYFK